MTQWVKVKLEDCCEKITSGGTPSRSNKEFFENGTIPWVKTGELKDSKLYSSQIEESITTDALNKSSAKLFPANTILMAMYGDGKTIGSLGIVQQTCASNQACAALITQPNKCDPVFLFHALKLYREGLIKLAYGGAQRNLTGALIKNYEIPVPPLLIQKKIAGVLSAYDDLIEANLRRIKLLEEMAQITYEEWFVRLRFPGHETTLKNPQTGLPEGWALANINTLFKIKYGKNLPATKITTAGSFPVYGASGMMGFYSEYNSDGKCVLITSRGNGSADIHRTYERSFVTNNSFTVNPQSGFEYLSLPFTMELLKRAGLKNYCSGAAQPQLTNDAMTGVQVPLPSKRLVENYGQMTIPAIEAADNLRSQNALLKEARDLMLPRLMTGMVDIDDYLARQTPLAGAA